MQINSMYDHIEHDYADFIEMSYDINHYSQPNSIPLYVYIEDR